MVVEVGKVEENGALTQRTGGSKAEKRFGKAKNRVNKAEKGVDEAEQGLVNAERSGWCSIRVDHKTLVRHMGHEPTDTG